MDHQTFTPINEPYHHYQQHYNYSAPINGQKIKKAITNSTTNNNQNPTTSNTLTHPSVNSTNSLVSGHQLQNNASSYLYNNNGNYCEAPSPSFVQDKMSSNIVLPPLSSLLPHPSTTVDIHSTTKYSSNTNYSHMNNMPYMPPNMQSPFNSNPRSHDVYLPTTSPNSCSTTDSYSQRNSTSSSTLDTENQKKSFQNMIARIVTKEDKRIVKISQQQQTSLLMKVLRFNQLKLAQMITQSNKTHHTISAQLLDNDKRLDVYVLARKKNIGVSSVSNMEKRVDCFKLDDFSFNVVVLEPNQNRN